MIKMPLGSFFRSRKDWTLEQLRYGSVVDTATANTYASITSLNNDAKDGTQLAVWGILALYTSTRGLMIAGMVQGQMGTFVKPGFQLNPLAAAIPGYVATTRATGTLEPQTTGIIFKADGSTWLQNDIPLFIIPPGYRCDVLPFEPIGLYNTSAMSAVTFLWGPYATARAQRR